MIAIRSKQKAFDPRDYLAEFELAPGVVIGPAELEDMHTASVMSTNENVEEAKAPKKPRKSKKENRNERKQSTKKENKKTDSRIMYGYGTDYRG